MDGDVHATARVHDERTFPERRAMVPVTLEEVAERVIERTIDARSNGSENARRSGPPGTREAAEGQEEATDPEPVQRLPNRAAHLKDIGEARYGE
jgi:hypothetical protein